MTASFVRAASPADATRIAQIYNQGIDDRGATFEIDHRTTDQILLWFEQGYPVFVAGEDSYPSAYAVAFPYRSRPCYEGVREFSVYVARDARGNGYGQLAMETLITASRDRGWWKLLSRVFPENLASRALCAKLGFREVGIYEKHGRLDGTWRDVVIVEKLLV